MMDSALEISVLKLRVGNLELHHGVRLLVDDWTTTCVGVLDMWEPRDNPGHFPHLDIDILLM
jgi:hypothetical protein